MMAMDELIQRVFRALSAGASIEDIHDSLATDGLSEEEIFLLIKAGELLYKGLVKLEAERQKRSVFRRIGN